MEPIKQPAAPVANTEAIPPEIDPTKVESPAAQTDDKPVTKRELAEAIEEGVRRSQQSARARTQSIETQVVKLTEQLTNMSIPVTPQMTEQMRTKIAADLEKTQEAPETEAPTPGIPGNPVYDWTMAFYKEAALDIKPTDKEWTTVKAALDDQGGSMIKYQAAVMKAIEQKRTRIASEGDSADARTLGGGSHSGQEAAGNARDLWKRVSYK